MKLLAGIQILLSLLPARVPEVQATPRDQKVHADAHASWREAIHRSRNGAARAVYAAQRSSNLSKMGEEALQQTIRRQEEAIPVRLRDEVKGFLDRLREES